jgi:hypothetical protein
MAYDQGYYPPQRPYNGRAAQPPSAPGYGPPRQYTPVQNDYYTADNYGGFNDGYHNGGYVEEPYQDPYYQPANGGGQYQQSQVYPPQQNFRGNANGNQNGGGRGEPLGRPPTAQGARGPDPRSAPPQGQVRGGGRGGGHGGAPVGRGGRPPPLERSTGSDPGGKFEHSVIAYLNSCKAYAGSSMKLFCCDLFTKNCGTTANMY